MPLKVPGWFLLPGNEDALKEYLCGKKSARHSTKKQNKNLSINKMPPKSSNKKVAKIAKKVVRQTRQKKVELKGRISGQVHFYNMYQNGDAVAPVVPGPTNGPNNTLCLVPETWSNPFTTGTQNGQVVGTEITPKYLNMKVKLNFDFLRRIIYMQANGVDPHIQRYDISIVQGWIKKDLRCHLSHEATNAQSGWSLPSFRDKADYTTALSALINQEMYNNSLEPEFLMYRQKSKSNIKVIRKFMIKGHQDENLVTGSDASSGDDNPVQGATPEQNLTFNWDLSNFNKTKMVPIGDAVTVDAEHVLGYSWIPFVQVRVDRRVLESTQSHEGGDPSAPALPNLHRSSLVVKWVNHFTYADS